MDPRVTTPQAKSANHSRLMKALGKASAGEVVNLCPFVIGDEGMDHLDEHGYCQHLIGFTLPGNPKKMEPRKPRYNTNNEVVDYFVDGGSVCDVPKGSVLEEITCSSRVYHKDGLPPPDRKPINFLDLDDEPVSAGRV